MTSRGIVDRTRVPSRGQFMRFQDADEENFSLRTPEGENATARMGRDEREEGKTPLSHALAALKTTKKPKIDKIRKEQPWVRVHGYNPGSGYYFQMHKVKMLYPEAASDEDTLPDERDRLRKATQDAHYVVRGHGRTELSSAKNGDPFGTLYLIPEGADPAEAAAVSGDGIYAHVKGLYAQHYKTGLTMAMTFTAVNEEGSFVEARIEPSGVPHDGRPEDGYNVKRPRTPEEFAGYVDDIAEGKTPETDDFARVLRAVNSSGYDWKVVPTYRILFAPMLRKSYQNSAGLGQTIKDDVNFGRRLVQEGAIDVGWKGGKRLNRHDGFAGYSVLGRFGALHDCYTSMEVLLAEDNFMKLPRVQDAIIATSPRTPVKGFVLDTEDISDWHEGAIKEVDFSLDPIWMGEVPEQTLDLGADEEAEEQGTEDATPGASPI